MADNRDENEDFENTDNESINIDDIFNENLFYEKWSNTQNNSRNDIDNSSILNSNSVALIPTSCNQYTPQLSNGYIPNRLLFDYEKYNYNNYFNNYGGGVANDCRVNYDYPLLNDNRVTHFCCNRSYRHLAQALTTMKRIPRHLSIPNVTRGIEKYRQQRCCVCNDYAVGKHYGVVTCEGCKGFFKRTIKYNHVYNCRENDNCVVDKEFRKRCQACRFHKCLAVGMRREAVQSISTSLKKPRYEEVVDSYLPEDPLKLNDDICQIMDINWEDMLQIEVKYNPDVEATGIMGRNAMELISGVFNEHLFSIVTWAKQIPGFGMLPISDQKLLLRMGWGELVIANLAHRSLKLQDDVILFRNGSKLMPEMAQQSGLGRLIDRIIFGILHQFRDLKVDRCELSYIKAIILFNPNLKDLENCIFVQTMRDMLCCSLQKYCLVHYPTERYRFNKLLLRLPTLRSIAHITVDHFRLYDSLRQSVSIVQKYHDGNNDRHLGPDWYGQHQFKFLCEMLSYADIILDH